MIKIKLKSAFTLMEILVVIIIVSIVSGFGITNYFKSREQSFLRNAENQLSLVKSAQELHFIRNDAYYPYHAAGHQTQVKDLNEDLNVNIITTGFAYKCDDTDDDFSFWCAATREGDAYMVVVSGFKSGSIYSNENDIETTETNGLDKHSRDRDGDRFLCYDMNSTCPY